MTASPNPATARIALLAGSFLDGTLAEPRRGVTILIEGGIIRAIADGTEPPRDATVLDLREQTVLPGLINMHAHTILPGDGTSVEAWSALPDELLVLKAATNASMALHSGVTTIRDCGGKGQIMFRLRDAIRTGIVPGPRFVLSGRPLTITGGHCRQFGGEVDGPETIRRAARELLREGADFIKLMAAGGGTVGTYPQYPAFDLDELRAAIDVAHQNGKPASCHCIATASIARALDAGTDHIEHCTFMAEDTTWHFDEALARRLAGAGVYVTATLQVGIDSTIKMKERYQQGIATPLEAQIVTLTPDRDRDSIENIRLLHAAGVPLVAGNDAGWRYTGFDDFYEELIHLHQAGLSTLEAIHAATGRAADACRLPNVGRLAEGCVADVLAVSGDPLADLGALARPALVMQGGQIVRDAR
jgi:imidazolonepropionase-like amidohydrolase